MAKRGIIIFALLALCVNLNAQSNKSVSLYQFANTHQLKIKIDLNLGIIELKKNNLLIKIYMMMPYITYQGRVFYVPSRLDISSDGDILLSSYHAKIVLAILKKPITNNNKITKPTVPDHSIKFEEQFIDLNKTNIMLQSVKSNKVNKGQKALTNTQLKKGTFTNKTIKKHSEKISHKDDKKTKKNYNKVNDFQPINAIVIDAGHGGKDIGAPGLVGVLEKDVVLSISKMLYDYLRAENQYKVFLTRKGDYFVTLEDRVKLTSKWAKNYHPIFISIHANAVPNPKVQGIEVFSLSDQAAGEEAHQVEMLENAGFSDVDIAKTEVLYSIIADLVRDSLKLESEKLASFVYKTLINKTGATGRGLKKAPLYVLKYNPVPAILVEVGFVSHPKEGAALGTKTYQKKIAQALFYGINEFISQYNKTKGFSQ